MGLVRTYLHEGRILWLCWRYSRNHLTLSIPKPQYKFSLLLAVHFILSLFIFCLVVYWYRKEKFRIGFPEVKVLDCKAERGTISSLLSFEKKQKQKQTITWSKISLLTQVFCSYFLYLQEPSFGPASSLIKSHLKLLTTWLFSLSSGYRTKESNPSSSNTFRSLCYATWFGR